MIIIGWFLKLHESIKLGLVKSIEKKSDKYVEFFKQFDGWKSALLVFFSFFLLWCIHYLFLFFLLIMTMKWNH